MSRINADQVAPSTGGTPRNLPRGVAAAWANLNGTGTIAARDSLNISSFVDNGVGNYSHNLTAAMVSTNYKVGASSNNGGSLQYPSQAQVLTAPVYRIWAFNNTTFADMADVFSDVHGSLA